MGPPGIEPGVFTVLTFSASAFASEASEKGCQGDVLPLSNRFSVNAFAPSGGKGLFDHRPMWTRRDFRPHCVGVTVRGRLVVPPAFEPAVSCMPCRRDTVSLRAHACQLFSWVCFKIASIPRTLGKS